MTTEFSPTSVHLTFENSSPEYELVLQWANNLITAVDVDPSQLIRCIIALRYMYLLYEMWEKGRVYTKGHAYSKEIRPHIQERMTPLHDAYKSLVARLENTEVSEPPDIDFDGIVVADEEFAPLYQSVNITRLKTINSAEYSSHELIQSLELDRKIEEDDYQIRSSKLPIYPTEYIMRTGDTYVATLHKRIGIGGTLTNNQ